MYVSKSYSHVGCIRLPIVTRMLVHDSSRVASAELSSSLFVTAVSYAYPAFRDNGRLPLSVRDHGNMVHAATAVVCMGLINSVNTAVVTSSGHGYPIGYGHTMVIRNASLMFQRVRDIHPSLIVYRRVRV